MRTDDHGLRVTAGDGLECRRCKGTQGLALQPDPAADHDAPCTVTLTTR